MRRQFKNMKEYEIFLKILLGGDEHKPLAFRVPSTPDVTPDVSMS